MRAPKNGWKPEGVVKGKVKLTDAEQRRVAQSACWYFDVYQGFNTGDSVVYTGDGVDDLDRVAAVIANLPERGTRMQCDVSGGVDSHYRFFDLEDLAAIRAYYVGWYGEVNKPNTYLKRDSSTHPIPATEL